MSLLPLVLGLVLFLGIHALTMNRLARARLVARVGPRYKALYSVISAIGLILIIWGFGHYRGAGMIPEWHPPSWTRHITYLLVLIAFILLAASHGPSHIRQWVRHPMITAVILWSLGHLLVRGDLGSILMFGSFLVWAVLARISMATRAAGDRGGPAPVIAARWRADVVAVVIGIVVYAVFVIWLHRLLIGVPLVAR